MHEKGHDSFSLRAVAKAAGYSAAGIYEYFSSKDALCSALAEEAWNNLGKMLGRATQNIEDPIERLIISCQTYVDYATTNREDFLLIFSLLPCPRESNEDPIPSGSALAVFLRNVGHAVKCGVIDAETEQEQITVMYALWASAHGIAHLRSAHLASYKADFYEINRSVFRAVIQGWTPRGI